jgi:hypothetical protein
MLRRTREATRSINPKAITTGNLDGNLNKDQMYTGKVGSVPVRKNAITNSSSDIVKPIKRLEINPGVTSGNITLKKVPILFSPRSSEASSRLLSKLLKAVVRIETENGVANSTCPAITVQRLNAKPNCIKTIKIETPTMISGKNSGAIIKPNIDCLPKKRCLAIALAVNTPKIVLINEAVIAISREFFNALKRLSSSISHENQSTVNPLSGNAIMALSLKAKSGNRITGAYRNPR